MTRRVCPEILYGIIGRYVNVMWPIVSLLGRLPAGRLANRSLFSIADYRGKVPLWDEMLKEWAILDTLDTFSPRYDKPQYLSTVRRWFKQAGLTEIEVKFSYNGIEGRGTKPVRQTLGKSDHM